MESSNGNGISTTSDASTIISLQVKLIIDNIILMTFKRLGFLVALMTGSLKARGSFNERKDILIANDLDAVISLTSK